MQKLFVVALAAVLGLALAAGNVWAGQGMVLNEQQLDRVWGGQLEVGDINVADDGGAANQSDRGGISSSGSGAVTRTELDLEVDVDNDAEDGSLANSGIVAQTVENSQNSASGLNLSNAMLSAVAQQSNVSSISGTTGDINTVGIGGVNVYQTNSAHVSALRN